MKNKTRSFFISLSLVSDLVLGQPIPSIEEGIPFVCTFSKNSDVSWGDNDFVQTFYYTIPKTQKEDFYLRLFDPDLGGKNDESHGNFDSKTKFTIYSGNRTVIATKTFGVDKDSDNLWVSLGPISPRNISPQGDTGALQLIIEIEGMQGDDGNLYRLFLSRFADRNEAVQGANSFSYSYCFRLFDNKGSVSHLYPYVNEKVTAMKIRIFDYDSEGFTRIVSNTERGKIYQPKEKNLWTEIVHNFNSGEKNTSLDLQFIKQNNVKNNNIVVLISNQYGESMPFYSAPIGGIPHYLFKIGVTSE